MAKENKTDNFIKQPVFKGGSKAIQDHVKHHLKYPEEAMKSKIEGTVHVRYDIDYKGNVVDGKIIKGIGHGCDEEAIRIIKLMKFEVAKSPRKLKVLYHKDIQIHFKLPKPKPIILKAINEKQQGMQITYNITGTVPAGTQVKKEKTPQPSTSYSYTIKLS